MKCPNCNSITDDGATKCPTCGADLRLNADRCPSCFTRLEKGAQVCPKCGCNVREYLAGEENANSPPSLADRILQMSTGAKVGIASAIACVIVIASALVLTYFGAQKRQFDENALKYISESEDCIKIIDELAGEYNNAYDGKWLVQSETTQSIDKKFADDISDVRQSRDTLEYLSSKMRSANVSSKQKALADEVCRSYNKCYLYVIEKQGKYPGYITGYNKLKGNYEKSVKDLKQNTDK